MQSGVVKFQVPQSASAPRSHFRSAVYCIALLGAGSACSSDVIDAGELVEVGEAGASGAPDAGGPQGAGGGAGGGAGESSTCNIPGLDQYRLLFDSDGGRLERRIYSMRADGTELEAITPLEELAREPALSPNGAQLAYTTPEGIRLLETATGQSELLVPNGSQADWSPDGAQLVGWTGSITILSMADRTEQAIFGCLDCAYPELTPDGANLVYSENIYREGVDSQSRLWSLSWQTGAGREIIPSTATGVTHPTVSPDGVWVAAAYQCPREDRSSLWVSPFAVTTPACEGRRTTRAGSASATNPEWGPGLLIAYEYGEPPRDIAIVSADTGEECVIERPGDDRNPSWAPIVFDAPQ